MPALPDGIGGKLPRTLTGALVLVVLLVVLEGMRVTVLLASGHDDDSLTALVNVVLPIALAALAGYGIEAHYTTTKGGNGNGSTSAAPSAGGGRHDYAPGPREPDDSTP